MAEPKKKIFKKGKAEFILPEKEVEKLAKQGKFSDPLQHSKEEKEERRETEIQNIAKKSVDIDKAKEGIKEGIKAEEEPAEELGADVLAQGEEAREARKTEVLQPEIPKNVETEEITFIDDAGIETTVQMPIGTNAKFREAEARREGRVPFDELPAYQQTLVELAITGASPKAIVKMGKEIKPLGAFITSSMGKVAGGVAGTAGIITWLASDNIIGGMSIYGRDLAEDVTFGKIDREKALEKFDEGVVFIEKAKTFIKTATIANPLLWPFRNIILTNTEAADLAMAENRERILRA